MSEPTDKTYTVLFVDDDSAVLDVARTALGLLHDSGKLNLQILTASSGTEALELAEVILKEGKPISAAFIDFHLGEIDGIEVFEKLLRSDPRIRASIVTGFPAEAEREMIRRHGKARCAVIGKPFSIKDLHTMTIQMIDLWEKAQSRMRKFASKAA